MVRQFVASLEDTPMSLSGWFAAFFGVVLLRSFLEAYSSPNISLYLASDYSTILHYTLFYLAVLLSVVVTTHFIARIPVVLLTKISLFALPLIWLAPCIDLLFGGARMSYLFVGREDLLSAFFTFFGPLTLPGVTLGIRIEVLVLLFCLSGYVYLKTNRLGTTLASAFAGYLVIFVALALPSVFFIGAEVSTVSSAWYELLSRSALSNSFLHASAQFTSQRTFELLFNAALAQFFFLATVVGVVLVALRAAPAKLREVLQNIRPERLIHYLALLMLVVLFAVTRNGALTLSSLDVISVLVVLLTVTLAWVFAVTTNDLADTAIDAVSNQGRPLVTGGLTQTDMQNTALLSGMLMSLGALSLGSYATFFVGTFTAAYYVYSMPPLRLKRVPLFAQAFVGAASLSVILLGFFLFSRDQSIAAFSPTLALVFFIAYTLGANMKDLKDIEGDARAGVMTLPTLLGERTSRVVIGGLLFVAFLLPLFVFRSPSVLVLSGVIGVLAWVGLAYGRGERYIFLLYFIYLALLAVYIFTFSIA
jgi:4-hydroxybenzoate polyprenyltransferase